MTQHSREIEGVRSQLRYADLYRKQASAADSLYGLLDCETPGTGSEVSVKGGRWFRRFLGRDEQPEEIILTTDERREFAQWCRERAAKLRKQADDTEARVLAGGSDGR